MARKIISRYFLHRHRAFFVKLNVQMCNVEAVIYSYV